MPNVVRWILAFLAVLLALGPAPLFYRYQYIHTKRFHEVTPGRFYRSGQMTASGFREIVDRFKIKSVLNLQHEEPDPFLADHWLGQGKIAESDLCKQLGVRYFLLTPDLLPPDNRLDLIPPAVDDFLKVLDDEANYPILLHCKAGLHRTGRLTAIYRMEFQNWTAGEALREARANGYGYIMASEYDPYVIQFFENYVPRKDRPKTQAMPAPPPHPAPLKRREGNGNEKGDSQ